MNYVLLLGIILLLALASNRIMKLVKLPAVTGYLIIGLLFAIFCLIFDFINKDSSFSIALNNLNSIVSSVALGFIALSIGEEFKLSKIKKYGGKIILITFLQAFMAVILVDLSLVIACLFLNLNLSIAICLGAIATATAPAATIMVINQYKAKGPLVDILLPVVAFDDAIGLVVFSISVSISKVIATGTVLSFTSAFLVPLIDIIISLLVGFILGLLMHLIMPYFKSRNNHEVIFIAFTLVGVGLCESLNTIKLFDEYLEVSNLLCCMMIGASYTNIVKQNEIDIMNRDFELIDRWTPFLFMLFFVLSGSSLTLSIKEMTSGSSFSSLMPVFIILITYLLFRSLGKYLGAFLGCNITGQQKSIRNHLGITLLPQAGVAIGMANQVSKIESFKGNNIGNTIIIVVLFATLIYELVGPLLTRISLNKVGEIPDKDGNYPYQENKSF